MKKMSDIEITSWCNGYNGFFPEFTEFMEYDKLLKPFTVIIKSVNSLNLWKHLGKIQIFGNRAPIFESYFVYIFLMNYSYFLNET